MLSVSQLYIYPVKSLGGISVNSAVITDRGLQYDRRYMLVDKNNIFLTQRELPAMALLTPAIEADELIIRHKGKEEDQISLPLIPGFTGDVSSVRIWDDRCSGQYISREVDEWVSDQLKVKCRLVYMPETTRRKVDPMYAGPDDITSFSDGYPLLLIGQASLDDLNNRLDEPLPMDRFRPSVVMAGSSPFEEDTFEEFSIREINFYGVKLCARCVITTTNQETVIKGKEPLKTLATYRLKNNNIYFGQNVLCDGEGEISVGDEIEIRKIKPPLL